MEEALLLGKSTSDLLSLIEIHTDRLSPFKKLSLEAKLQTYDNHDLLQLHEEKFKVSTLVTIHGEEKDLLGGVNSKNWAQTKEFIKALQKANVFIVLDIEAMGPTNEYAPQSLLERGPGRYINLVDIYLHFLKKKMEDEFPGCTIIKHGGDEFLICGTVLSGHVLDRAGVQNKLAGLAGVRHEVFDLSEDQFSELQTEYSIKGTYEDYINACANSLRLAHYREIRRTLNKEFDKEHEEDGNAHDQDTLARYIQFLETNYYQQTNKDDLALFLNAYKHDAEIKKYINQEFMGKADEVCDFLQKLSKKEFAMDPFEKIQALEHWVSILRGFPRKEIPEELKNNSAYTKLHEILLPHSFVEPPTLLGIHGAAYNMNDKPEIKHTDAIYQRIGHGLGTAKNAQEEFPILAWGDAEETKTSIFQQAKRMQTFEQTLEDIAVSRYEISLLLAMQEEAQNHNTQAKIDQMIQVKKEKIEKSLNSLIEAGQEDADTEAYTPRYCAQSLNATAEYKQEQWNEEERVFEVADMHMSAGPINNFIGYKVTDNCVKNLVKALKQQFYGMIIVRTGPADVRLISTATKIESEDLGKAVKEVNQLNMAYLQETNPIGLQQAIRDAAGRNGLNIFQTVQHSTEKAGQFVLKKQRSLTLGKEDLEETLYALIERAV